MSEALRLEHDSKQGDEEGGYWRKENLTKYIGRKEERRRLNFWFDICYAARVNRN